MWFFRNFILVKKLLLFLCILLAACSDDRPTVEVMVLPGLHQYHESNPNYSVEELFAQIRRFRPDYIGVEIRPVDMSRETSELMEFYPDEMVRVRDSFPEIVTGIDFYSPDTKELPVSPELFNDSLSDMGRALRLFTKMAADREYTAARLQAGIDELQQEQLKIIRVASPGEMMTGRFDSLTAVYYNRLYALMEERGYGGAADFNRQRDERIAQRALALVRANPDKRGLLLVGASHRHRLVKTLREAFPNLVIAGQN